MVSAYRTLEDRGLIEARPQSGFYVRSTLPALKMASAPSGRIEPPADDVLALIDTVFAAQQNPAFTNIALACPQTSDFYPGGKLGRMLSSQLRRQPDLIGQYSLPPGSLRLRQQIARRSMTLGMLLEPGDVVLTHGCMEALQLALRVTTKPGDCVGLESPTYFYLLPLLASLGLKALEIPTDPLTGVSLAALEMALEQWPIKAILLTPNCNNPLGYIMPDAHKQRLLTLAQRHDAAIIEDDVYGDIAYHYPRPRTIKSFDEDGRVLLCSSFSKTLAPGLRVGWIAPGRYLERVLHMKFIGSGATATQPQLAIAEFIRGGHYLQHLRRMRARYQQNRDRMTDLILKHFPAGTRVSRPRGGFMLWIELDEAFDTLRLNRHLEQQGVQIAVGSIFSAAGKYRNCLRINYAPKLTAEIEQAVQRVGATILALMPSGVLQPQAD